MFRRCIACNADLGGNEALEAFPVGKRLAFDAAKGRLWVVCPACKQWNLSPLEERWDAIEAAEKLYRDTKKRVTTDEVGLARAADGTDLVRIGAPQRPEFAAWRYGERFVRRRTKHLALVAGGIAAGGALLAGGVAAGAVTAGSIHILTWAIRGVRHGYRRLRVATRYEDDEGRRHLITLAHARRAALVQDDASGWRLEVPTVLATGDMRERLFGSLLRPLDLRGPDAFRALGQLLPHVNASGARPEQVQHAVAQLEGGESLAALATRAARTPRGEISLSGTAPTLPASLRDLPVELRLALEMALHEDDERRWLEGKLDDLTDRWREAEEVAAIADRLLVPWWVEARLGERREEG